MQNAECRMLNAECGMQNARRKPHKMRTVDEWREIYLRVRDWDGGEGNPVHRQCPVCLGRFTPKKADARFCSQSCRNLWSRARAIAGETSREAPNLAAKRPNLAPQGAQPRREAARRYVELAVCEDCGKTFRRPSSEDRPGRPQSFCRECARKRQTWRYRTYKAKRKANAECRMQNAE